MMHPTSLEYSATHLQRALHWVSLVLFTRICLTVLTEMRFNDEFPSSLEFWISVGSTSGVLFVVLMIRLALNRVVIAAAVIENGPEIAVEPTTKLRTSLIDTFDLMTILAWGGVVLGLIVIIPWVRWLIP